MIRSLIAVALAILLTVLALSVPPREAPADASPASGSEAERTRIAVHLARVEARLREADVSHLTVAQRAARAHQLDVLRAYRLAGSFPHNHVVAGARSPVFVDEHGTHCAVGYLLARSGETQLVRRIAGTRNTATVPELSDEPGLLDWLERNGLTADEAAQIQPRYGPVYDVETVHGPYATGTVALTAASAAASTWNLLADRTGDRWYLPAVAGLASGAASLAWGARGAGLEEVALEAGGQVRRTASDAHVAINVVAGVVSAALGTRTLLLGRSDDAREGGVAQPARLELAPTAGLGGAGFRGAFRF